MIRLTTTGQILAAGIAQEERRDLMRCAREHAAPRLIRQRLADFYAWYAITNVAEVHRLVSTIETWWPRTLRFLKTGLTNACTEGINRIVVIPP